MPPSPHRQTAEAAEALITVAPLIDRWIERLLATGGPPLTPAQFLALKAIDAGTTSSSALAHSAGVSAPAVSQLVANLVQTGLLERGEFPGDRRRLRLQLTRQGTQALTNASMLLSSRLTTILGELPPPEADALARALPSVEAMLSGAPPPRRPGPRPPAPVRPAH